MDQELFTRTLYDNVKMTIDVDLIIDSNSDITITNSKLEIGGDIDIRSDGNTIENNDINVKIIDNTGITNITGAPFVRLMHGSEQLVPGMTVSQDISIVTDNTDESVRIEINGQEYNTVDRIIEIENLSEGMNTIRYSVNGTSNAFFTNIIEFNVSVNSSDSEGLRQFIIIPLIIGIPILITLRKRSRIE